MGHFLLAWSMNDEGISLLSIGYGRNGGLKLVSEIEESWVKSFDDGVDTDPCKWPGVNCNEPQYLELPAVIEFNLTGKGIYGFLPPEIGDLFNLERLDLRNNNIEGTVPNELGYCKNLEYAY